MQLWRKWHLHEQLMDAFKSGSVNTPAITHSWDCRECTRLCGGCLMVACWLTRGQTHTIDHAMIDFALSAVQTSIEAHPPRMKVPKNSIGPSRPRSSQACRSSEDFAGRNKLKSARTVGAKGRVFPEALTQSALAGGGGGSLFLQVKCMVRS